MSAPSVPFATWILAAFDPVLIALAVYLGWRADQAAKIVVVAIAALGASLLFDYAATSIGIPMPAPVSQSGPMLLPVRSVASLAWAAAGYFGARLWARRRREL